MNKELVDKLNRPGDEALFNYATKNGNLRIFDAKKSCLFIGIVPFCIIALAFGILSLYLVIFENIHAFLFMGIIATAVSLGVPYLFFYEDKRILKEAKRRNQFVPIAEKRWLWSKRLYLIMIFFSLFLVFLYFVTNSKFLQKGVITSNGTIIYDGRNIER